MKISSYKSKILVNSIRPRPSATIRTDGEDVDQFKSNAWDQHKPKMEPLKEIKNRLAQAHSAMTRLAVLWRKKTKPLVFPER